MSEPIADVVLSCGRWHLRVAGFYLATEGDKCRDGNLPEHVFDPIPPEELAQASIGGKPAGELPIDVVRFFWGDNWNEKMLRYVADGINRAVARRVPPDSAP